jgi:hypothetical protein
MTKHISIGAEVTINSPELLMASKEDINEHVKSELAYNLGEAIANSDLGTLTWKHNPNNCSTDYRLSLVFIKLDDYKELHDAILRNNFQFMKDGKVISLIDLL